MAEAKTQTDQAFKQQGQAENPQAAKQSPQKPYSDVPKDQKLKQKDVAYDSDRQAKPTDPKQQTHSYEQGQQGRDVHEAERRQPVSGDRSTR